MVCVCVCVIISELITDRYGSTPRFKLGGCPGIPTFCIT